MFTIPRPSPLSLGLLTASCAFTALGLASYYVYRPNGSGCSNAAAITTDEAAGKTDHALAALAFERHLESYKAPHCLSPDKQLSAFSLETQPHEVAATPGLYSLSYSIKPKYQFIPLNTDYWRAGNGREDGNWIVGKYASFRLTKEVGGYRATEIGSGP